MVEHLEDQLLLLQVGRTALGILLLLSQSHQVVQPVGQSVVVGHGGQAAAVGRCRCCSEGISGSMSGRHCSGSMRQRRCAHWGAIRCQSAENEGQV